MFRGTHKDTGNPAPANRPMENPQARIGVVSFAAVFVPAIVVSVFVRTAGDRVDLATERWKRTMGLGKKGATLRRKGVFGRLLPEGFFLGAYFGLLNFHPRTKCVGISVHLLPELRGG